MLRKAIGHIRKADVIRQAATEVEFEKLTKGERNTAIRLWVDQRYPEFGWSTNPAALIAGALKSKRWRTLRPGGQPVREGRNGGVHRNFEPALLLALRAGGFSEARAQLFQVQSDPLLEFIISAGGIARALKLLDEAETRVYCGTGPATVADG